MNQKVVLPRFDLPRDSTRIAIRAVLAAGALMVVAVLVLGMAMWHRRSVEIATAEQAAAKAEAARRAAMAPPAPAAPVQAPAAAPAGLAGSSETTMAAVIPSSASSAEPAHRSAVSHSRRGGKSSAHVRPGAHGSASAGGKSASGAPAKRSNKVDDDFIDKLLSK